MNSWIIENLGWTLLHSFWQIAFVTLILFVALRMLREFSANLRYLASILALSLSLILPIATFIYLSNSSSNVTAKAINQISQPASIEQFNQISEPKLAQENNQISSLPSPNIAVTSSSPNIPFLPILVSLWLIGVLIFSVRLAGGVWTVHLYKTRQVSAVDESWQAKFDELCASLQIRQKVKFLQSQMVEIPVVIGWLKPVVLFPASAFLQISPNELETILIHELTHIQRNDYLVNLMQTLVEILFFFHPCVWWMSAQIRTEREFAVDEIVSQMCETERFIYAKALANLEESRATAPILAMAADGGNLMKRIEKILNGSRKISSKNVSIWSAVFAVTLILGTIIGIYWISANKNKSNGRKIAIVYGGMPFVNKDYINQDFFNLLEKHKIPAVWILNQISLKQMAQDESVKTAIRHRYHQNIKFALNTMDSASNFVVPEDNFEELTKKNMEYLNNVLATEGGKVDYFYFIDGMSQYRSEAAQKVEKSLFQQGLKNIPTSAPHYDSLFSLYYEKICITETNTFNCQEDRKDKNVIREKYLKFMTEQFESMERYSQEVLGREIPQVLYLSASKLNDDSADEIFQILKDRGYEFVPLEEVMVDETYAWQEKVRKVMRFDRNRWDKTAEYLKDVMNISSKSQPEKPIKDEVKNGKATTKTK